MKSKSSVTFLILTLILLILYFSLRFYFNNRYKYSLNVLRKQHNIVQIKKNFKQKNDFDKDRIYFLPENRNLLFIGKMVELKSNWLKFKRIKGEIDYFSNSDSSDDIKRLKCVYIWKDNYLNINLVNKAYFIEYKDPLRLDKRIDKTELDSILKTWN